MPRAVMLTLSAFMQVPWLRPTLGQHVLLWFARNKFLWCSDNRQWSWKRRLIARYTDYSEEYIDCKAAIVIWFFTGCRHLRCWRRNNPTVCSLRPGGNYYQAFGPAGHYLAVIAGLAVCMPFFWTVGGLMASKLGEISGQHLFGAGLIKTI